MTEQPHDLDPRLVNKVLQRVLNLVTLDQEQLQVFAVIRGLALEDAANTSPKVRAHYLDESVRALAWILDPEPGRTAEVDFVSKPEPVFVYADESK